MFPVIDHSVSFSKGVKYTFLAALPDENIRSAEAHYTYLRRHWTQVIVRIANGRQPRTGEEGTQLQCINLIPQREWMNHLSSVQFLHHGCVICRPVMCRWMGGYSEPSLLVHLVQSATRGQPPIDGVP